MTKKIFSCLTLLFCILCLTIHAKLFAQTNAHHYKVKFESKILYDSSRHRDIPVAYYSPINKNKTSHQAIVIISHGYGNNNPNSYLGYTYLTQKLAAYGYFVVSIQHELNTDSLIPSTGIPQIVRRPFWERGADNIKFVIDELKKTNPLLDYNQITLIGHSNGGDMSALFPLKYPNIASKIISLDNRRMALPKTTYPQIYSLRSCDQIADEGVLPSAEEQLKYGIHIIKLSNTKHSEMDDSGNKSQRKEILRYVFSFLK